MNNPMTPLRDSARQAVAKMDAEVSVLRNDGVNGVGPAFVAAAEACIEYVRALPDGEECGPGVEDGCDHEGFVGGCERFGHTPYSHTIDALHELADLHDSIRTVYGQCPGLPISAEHPEDFDAATNALHGLCLIVGLHGVEVPAYATPAQATRVGDARDAERLDWLEANELALVSEREEMGDGYAIWWRVIRVKAIKGESVSGHPLGSVRAAIDAATQHPAAVVGKEGDS